MGDRLVVDLGADGMAAVLLWPEGGGAPDVVSRTPLVWPLDGDTLEDLRWYLEDYLTAPFGVWEDRGPAVRGKLAGWGDQVFASVFGSVPALGAYQRAVDKGLEVVFQSEVPGLLGLPWELAREPAGPVALRAGGFSRSLPVSGRTEALEVPGGRLRVLMVISRPAGTDDVGFQMVARPLLERLDAVRGDVELTVLRPATFGALRGAVRQAADDGRPFHVVHFDGHGGMAAGTGGGVLSFELPGGGSGPVKASRVAAALAAGRVPVVVLNACQSGAMGKEVEASVATALLHAGCTAVVAMAYSVYAVTAAEFMAAFYESLFVGETLGKAVEAGRRRLLEHDSRPSPKGDMPLDDWLVPVHYSRREVSFPQARASRPAAAPSLDTALDQIRAAPSEVPVPAQDQLAAAGAFVGRDDMYYQLEVAALEQRVVVLSGPGGTGKTELAKGFARWWRDTGGVDDRQLVYWHSFEPGMASFGLDGVITGFGMEVFGTDFARLAAPQRLEAVQQLMAEHRALLVWDNFESVAEMPDSVGATPPLDEGGRAQLREFLAWIRDHSASTVIITSRAPEIWLGQVSRITVGGLNRVEAAQYAGYLLAPFPAAQQRRGQRSFGELLEWLDGHPLAIRLTLPRLEGADPADLLAELRGATSLPAGDDTGPGRLSSLGACIDYSFTHLTGQAQRLLPAVSMLHGVVYENLLTVFSAAETVPARFAVAGWEEWTTVLQDAARVGLLTDLGAGMYRIHPALPGALAARWRASGPDNYDQEREACEQILRVACAAFSQWLAGQIRSGEAGLAFTLIGLQRRTLGAMLGRALDDRAWGDAERIVRALDAYWNARGLGVEAAAWADRILAAIAGPGEDPPAPAQSLWLYTINQEADRQKAAGQPDTAAQSYRHVLAYLQAQPATDRTREDIAVAFHQLGTTAQARGRLDEADEWYRKSLAINEELDNRPSMAVTYHELGISAQERGRFDEANDWLSKSLAINEELGNRPYMAMAYHELGMTAYARGRLDEADEWYRKSLAINEELDNRPYIAMDYHQLGMTAQDRGWFDEADEWYRKSLAINHELGNYLSMAITYHQLGRAAQARGWLDEADEWYRKSLAISQALGNPGMAKTFHQLGMTAHLRGRLDEADEWYRKSLAIEEEVGNLPGIALTYHELGITTQARGRLDDADDWLRKSLAINEELGDRPSMALNYAQLGLLAEARGQALQALVWNIQCVTLFGQFPSPLTGSGPSALTRLTRQLGVHTLVEAWQQVTGHPLPQQVREYITSRHNDESSQP